MSKFLRIAPLLILLSACSKAVSIAPMPPPPANLAQRCQALPEVPVPLIDPDRLQWGTDVLAAYGDCALKHKLLADAWLDAANSAKK